MHNCKESFVYLMATDISQGYLIEDIIYKNSFKNC